MSTTTDYPDFAPHVALAAQVAATGVPLLHGANLLLTSGLQSIAASGQYTHAVITFTQPSYEIQVTCFANAASANPFVSLELQWIDSASGAIIARDTIALAAGSVVSGWLTLGRGPTKADQLFITATNGDAGHSMIFGIIVLQTSRVFDRDVWRWDNTGNAGNAIPGFTLPSLPADDAMLGTVSAGTLIASGASTWLCGCGYGGTVNLGMHISTTPFASVVVTAYARPTSFYPAAPYMLRTILTAADATFQFKPARGLILLEFFNSSATAGTVYFGLTVGQDG